MKPVEVEVVCDQLRKWHDGRYITSLSPQLTQSIGSRQPMGTFSVETDELVFKLGHRYKVTIQED
jgi:hypothetical protein